MKTLLSIALLLALTSPAAAQRGDGLFWLTGEIRGQLAAVEAQARATLVGCDDADDVFDELRDLCRELDRFERELQRPIHSRNQLRRLARQAEEVDEEACDLQEEIEEALEDLRDDRRDSRRRHFGYRGHADVFQTVGYPIGRVSTHRLAQTRGYTDLINGRSRGVSFAVGGRYGPVVSFGLGGAPGFYRVGSPVTPDIAVPLPAPGIVGPRLHHGGIGFDDGCALRDQMAQLRGLTRQLRRIVGG